MNELESREATIQGIPGRVSKRSPGGIAARKFWLREKRPRIFGKYWTKPFAAKVEAQPDIKR